MGKKLVTEGKYYQFFQSDWGLNLTPNEMKAFLAVRDYSKRSQRGCFAKQATIADAVGLDKTAVSRAIKGLVEKGVVTKAETGITINSEHKGKGDNFKVFLDDFNSPLKPTELKALAVIRGYSYKDGKCKYTLGQLAEKMSVEYELFRRTVKKLIDSAVISKVDDSFVVAGEWMHMGEQIHNPTNPQLPNPQLPKPQPQPQETTTTTLNNHNCNPTNPQLESDKSTTQVTIGTLLEALQNKGFDVSESTPLSILLSSPLSISLSISLPVGCFSGSATQTNKTQDEMNKMIEEDEGDDSWMRDFKEDEEPYEWPQDDEEESEETEPTEEEIQATAKGVLKLLKTKENDYTTKFVATKIREWLGTYSTDEVISAVSKVDTFSKSREDFKTDFAWLAFWWPVVEKNIETTAEFEAVEGLSELVDMIFDAVDITENNYNKENILEKVKADMGKDYSNQVIATAIDYAAKDWSKVSKDFTSEGAKISYFWKMVQSKFGDAQSTEDYSRRQSERIDELQRQIQREKENYVVPREYIRDTESDFYARSELFADLWG